MMAPEERGYLNLLKRLDREVFRVVLEQSEPSERLPLEGYKLHVHVDWNGLSRPESTGALGMPG